MTIIPSSEKVCIYFVLPLPHQVEQLNIVKQTNIEETAAAEVSYFTSVLSSLLSYYFSSPLSSSLVLPYPLPLVLSSLTIFSLIYLPCGPYLSTFLSSYIVPLLLSSFLNLWF